MLLQAYIGVWQTGLLGGGRDAKYVVISFRGTIESSLVDWISDLSYKQITPNPRFPSMKVHEGFYNAYVHSLQSQVLAALAELPDVPVLVTGMSFSEF